jgi:hypothetical protein
VTARETAWLQVTADGARKYSGVFKPGESRSWTAEESASVWTGNAGAIDVSHNGHPVGGIGPRGMVRTVVVTREGAEIKGAVPPKIGSVATPAPDSARAPRR